MKISKKVAGVEYAIRDIVSAAREIELQGKTVDYLNIGDPVQSGFQPPQNVKQAMIGAINNGNNFYTRSEGLIELTDAIAKKENAKGLSISSENISGYQAYWDGRDNQNRLVKTGIYLVKIFDKKGKFTFEKIAVINQ